MPYRSLLSHSPLRRHPLRLRQAIRCVDCRHHYLRADRN